MSGRRALAAGLALLTLGAAAQATPPPPPSGVNIDCARTTYAAEQLICGDRLLMQRDAAMMDLYRRALAAAPSGSRGVLEAGQLAWMRERNLCAFRKKGRDCVLRQYQAREDALRALTDPR